WTCRLARYTVDTLDGPRQAVGVADPKVSHKQSGARAGHIHPCTVLSRCKWRQVMRQTYGIGDFRYEYVDGWGKLPAGITFLECPGVAVDAQDNVYILTRGEHPVIVFDREGNYLRTFGEGRFSDRTHGLYIAHDNSLLIADDGIHTIQKFHTNGDM